MTVYLRQRWHGRKPDTPKERRYAALHRANTWVGYGNSLPTVDEIDAVVGPLAAWPTVQGWHYDSPIRYYGLPPLSDTEQVTVRQNGYAPADTRRDEFWHRGTRTPQDAAERRTTPQEMTVKDFPEPTQWNGPDLRDWPHSDGVPIPYFCLDCGWQGRGMDKRFEHFYLTRHHVIWGKDPRALAALNHKPVTE